MTGKSIVPASARRLALASLVFVALAIAHTYPLITGLDHLSRHNDDEWLNAWAVSWISQQLVSNPSELFSANMYFPTEQSLAYTEPLIVPGILGAPVHWLGTSPLLTYNVLLLLGMALTALGMYSLIYRWTGDYWCGIVAGAILAFGAPTMTRLPHLQAIHFYWLPLALLALDNLLVYRRTRDAVWLGGCVFGAALTSGYTAIFVVFALGAATVVRAHTFWQKQGLGVLLRLAGAATLTLVLGFLVLHPYQDLQVSRPLPVAGDFTSTIQMYLSSNSHVHYGTWGQSFYARAPDSFFPGVVALLLTVMALVSWTASVPKRVRSMLIAIAAMGAVFSLGTLTPVYAWFYDLVPPIQSLRAPERFGILVYFSVAALAGVGLARLRQHVALGWNAPVAVAILLITMVETFHGPAQYRSLDWAPRIYRSLGALGDGPVLSLPIHRGRDFNRNATYLLASTLHWRPLVNGFGNSQPPEFDQRAAVASRFPSPLAVAYLQAVGVQHVVVHTDRIPGSFELLDRLRRRTDFTLIAEDGPDRLYRINALPEAPFNSLIESVNWSELTYIERPGLVSFLVGWHDLGEVFGLQDTSRLLLNLERTTADSRLALSLPMPMRGQYFDGTTGEVVGNVTVEPLGRVGPPAPIDVPSGYESLVLDLRAAY